MSVIDLWLRARLFQPVIDRTGSNPREVARFCMAGAIVAQCVQVYAQYPSVLVIMTILTIPVYTFSYYIIRYWAVPPFVRFMFLAFFVIFTPWNILNILYDLNSLSASMSEIVNGLVCMAAYFNACRMPPPREQKAPVGKLAPTLS